jgi:hypothetical protein
VLTRETLACYVWRLLSAVAEQQKGLPVSTDGMQPV